MSHEDANDPREKRREANTVSDLQPTSEADRMIAAHERAKRFGENAAGKRVPARAPVPAIEEAVATLRQGVLRHLGPAPDVIPAALSGELCDYYRNYLYAKRIVERAGRAPSEAALGRMKRWGDAFRDLCWQLGFPGIRLGALDQPSHREAHRRHRMGKARRPAGWTPDTPPVPSGARPAPAGHGDPPRDPDPE